MRFSGKTVVVTGAASGIGKAAVLLFASEGATVYAADIDATNGEKLAEGSNGDIRFQRCDVCSTEDIRTLMDRAAVETGEPEEQRLVVRTIGPDVCFPVRHQDCAIARSTASCSSGESATGALPRSSCFT